MGHAEAPSYVQGAKEAIQETEVHSPSKAQTRPAVSIRASMTSRSSRSAVALISFSRSCPPSTHLLGAMSDNGLMGSRRGAMESSAKRPRSGRALLTIPNAHQIRDRARAGRPALTDAPLPRCSGTKLDWCDAAPANGRLTSNSGKARVSNVQLPMTKEFIGSQADVFDNLAQEDWRDVSATVDGYCCTSSIGMAKLLVGAPLPYLFEPEAAENRNHLAGGENR